MGFYFRARQIRGQVDDLEAEIVKGENIFMYKRYLREGMDEPNEKLDIRQKLSDEFGQM